MTSTTLIGISLCCLCCVAPIVCVLLSLYAKPQPRQPTDPELGYAMDSASAAAAKPPMHARFTLMPARTTPTTPLFNYRMSPTSAPRSRHER